MTAWIPDVIPDETIESEWGNSIRNRVNHTFADAAERDTAIPTPELGMRVFLESTSGLYTWDGSAWYGHPRGRKGYDPFGEVNRSTVGYFTSFSLVLADPRLITVEYSIYATQLTAGPSSTTLHTFVTGEAERRIFSRSMGLGETLIPGSGAPVTGRQPYSLDAGTYTIGLKLAQITAGALRSHADWDNYLAAYDYGSP